MSPVLLHRLTGQLVRAVEEARMAVPQGVSCQRWLGARLALLDGGEGAGGLDGALVLLLRQRLRLRLPGHAG